MTQTKVRFDRAVEGATNIVDEGTEGTKVASGTTAQRGSTAGQIRFNSTTGLAEYYTGTAFKTIDSPPTVSSIDVTEVDSQAGGNQTIVITGSSFSSGATVTYVGNAGTDFNASTVTVDSSTQITAVAPKSSFLNAQEPYGVKVQNTSGLSATLASQINVDSSPSWSTASGQIGGNLFESETVNTSATATDSDGDTIVYSVQSGSLPSGLSLNTSSGAITGTASNVSADTTSSFTLRATANSKTADRAFSIIIKNDLTSVVDFFGDSSGKSLYQFDNNGTDAGGVGNFGYGHPGTFGGSAGGVSYNTSTKKLGTHSLYKILNGDYGYINSRAYSSYTVCGWHNPSNLNQGDTHFAGLFGNQSSGQLLTSKLTSTGDSYLGINYSFSNGNGETGDKYIANATGCPTLSNGTWYHWTWTRDGTDTRLYVNGVLGVTITEAISNIAISSHTLYLGTASTQLGNTTYDTSGYYDNIRIFNKKLSQSEITTLYNFESTR